jgi:hypothetical protein
LSIPGGTIVTHDGGISDALLEVSAINSPTKPPEVSVRLKRKKYREGIVGYERTSHPSNIKT